VVVAVSLWVAACGDARPIVIHVDGGVADDASSPDAAPQDDAAGRPDVPAEPDAALPPDASPVDAALEDGGDAGAPADAQPPDAAAAGDAAVATDPEQPGPFAVVAAAGRITVPATSHSVPFECRFGDGAPPGPLVLIAPGFQIAHAAYLGYAEHLATFGYLACTIGYSVGLPTSHVDAAADLSGAADHLFAESARSGAPLEGRIEPDRMAIVGHSLGGKLAVLAASADPRVLALVGLDPVDAATFCNATRCPDATDRLPLPIPLAVLGETLDQTPAIGGQACAPQAAGYTTFYQAASSPALEVTVSGAGHISFVGDLAACGFACSLCQSPTAPQDEVLAMSRAFVTAFLERHLRGDASYQTYLDGAAAQQRYVSTQRASLRSK
jgi:dienelactone hydrolase